jgi:hypothetical protein
MVAVLTHPTPARRDASFLRRGRSERGPEAYPLRYVEGLRFTPRWIKRGTFVNAAEMVRRPCLLRTKLADIFSVPLMHVVGNIHQ